jgi:D-alanyl-D-alanine carboxypeptidase
MLAGTRPAIFAGEIMGALAEHTAAELQSELNRSWAADDSLPGLIATVHAPRIGLAWSGACGNVHRDGGEVLTPTHAFRLASVTKPYTSAVALRLSEQGRFDLFAPIAPLLEPATLAMLEAGGYEPTRITPFHLLTHGSGLRDHAQHGTPFGAAVLSNPSRIWTHAEQVELCMVLGGPLSEPGTHFSYSDTAYVILGDLLERVAGQPLHQLMRGLLHFEHLGLVQTHFERHEPTPSGQRRAGQYFGTLEATSIDCSSDLSGGGGLIATTDEMARFFRAVTVGELFERRQTTALALATPSLIFTPGRESLHAPLMRGRWVGSEQGWSHGGFWGAFAAYFPGSDVTMALCVNQAVPGETTVGKPRDPTNPSLADRLANVVQAAGRTQTA